MPSQLPRKITLQWVLIYCTEVHAVILGCQKTFRIHDALKGILKNGTQISEHRLCRYIPRTQPVWVLWVLLQPGRHPPGRQHQRVLSGMHALQLQRPGHAGVLGALATRPAVAASKSCKCVVPPNARNLALLCVEVDCTLMQPWHPPAGRKGMVYGPCLSMHYQVAT